MKQTLQCFLQASEASVRLTNTLVGGATGRRRGRLTLSQFFQQWPPDRLRREVFGFGPKACRELGDLLWEWTQVLPEAQNFVRQLHASAPKGDQSRELIEDLREHLQAGRDETDVPYKAAMFDGGICAELIERCKQFLKS